jgi:hypothetical protein
VSATGAVGPVALNQSLGRIQYANAMVSEAIDALVAALDTVNRAHAILNGQLSPSVQSQGRILAQLVEAGQAIAHARDVARTAHQGTEAVALRILKARRAGK